MKLYQTIDGTLIGFYQERGGEVQATMYRDVYETRTIEKTRDQRIWVPSTERTVMELIPGFYDTRTLEIPGRYEDRAVRIPEHEEEQLVKVPGFYERQTYQLPGHYEIQPYWFDAHTVTRYYYQPAHPARGLEEKWIPYEEDVPAGYKDTRVWIEGEWRTHVVWVDATWEYQMVMVPEAWGTKTIWVEPISRTREVWIPEKRVAITFGEPGHWDTTMVMYSENEEVWVGYEPVYGFLNESQTTLFEVLDLNEGGAPGQSHEDVITIRNRLTGEELDTTATLIGYAERIDDNEYVVPP